MTSAGRQQAAVLQRGRRADDWLLNQLPTGMLDDDFFVRFVRIFQTVATTLMEGADNLEHVLDVTVAPVPMVRWLGTWLGVDDVDSALPHDIQRSIVATTGQMLAWRGTARGLSLFLEMVTGGPVEIVESGGVFAEGQATPGPPTIGVRVASSGWVQNDHDFVALVRRELPIAASAEIRIGERLVWPTATPVAIPGPMYVESP
ncbi:MAG: phage tail protein [Acidimicrobiales bacterium]|nr:phage tail protein [Acidimicrobiales bacterium]